MNDDAFAAELAGDKPWPLPRGLDLMLQPLPPVLSEREQYEADECASAQSAIPDNDGPAIDLG